MSLSMCQNACMVMQVTGSALLKDLPVNAYVIMLIVVQTAAFDARDLETVAYCCGNNQIILSELF